MRATAALQTKIQIPLIPARYGTGPSVKALFKVYLHFAGHQNSLVPTIPILHIAKYPLVNIDQKQLTEVIMSNKQITNAVRLANSLTKDISGNLLSGQEMRVVEYLQILRSVLDGLEEKLEAGSDFKAEQNLETVMVAVDAKLNNMTPTDKDRVGPSMEKWAKKGITLAMLVEPQA